MNTKPLEKFAQLARRQLHKEVAAKLERVLTTDSGELRAKASTLAALKAEIAGASKKVVVERVAYTWFNRFCALRFMDVNDYNPTRIVSPLPGSFEPELLQEAKQGLFPRDVDEMLGQAGKERTLDLLTGRTPSPDAQNEAYRLLLVAACNSLHKAMPYLFEAIDDYSELLMPDDLLSGSSILAYTREAMTPDVCQNVEVIGWLYQFYISEKKDKVIGSKAPIPAPDIPAATQLFTPHWIVRYLVENSLGRLWMQSKPGSRLVEKMEYFIGEQGSGIGDQGSGTGDSGLGSESGVGRVGGGSFPPYRDQRSGEQGSGSGDSGLDQSPNHPISQSPNPQSLPPDPDGVLPILDGEWFEDDIVAGVRRFVRVAFGPESYDENIAFIEAALGRDLRSYFLREFYDDHLKRYSNRPIYWLFSSDGVLRGQRGGGSFNALIYLHRYYTPDTPSLVLNDYLRAFMEKLTARKQHLAQVAVSPASSPKQKRDADKEIDAIDKQLTELEVYEREILFPLASQRIPLDLDDGVKVNYAKLGSALRKVKGLNG